MITVGRMAMTKAIKAMVIMTIMTKVVMTKVIKMVTLTRMEIHSKVKHSM